ncbi:copper resistance CopC/CopD family protein [Streptomyces endophyticus]|uniref:Copper resistance protein CopC n=1 Tax=Streptomyces endophyticus TaxID=714166 RepID=A0ABU6F8K3_9ACTN|nr:copper resistance CopC family protein [Streptomyces endophyticus]MEB8340343.1 copper resistance protein CopC [Streptomyces endophyticus]
MRTRSLYVAVLTLVALLFATPVASAHTELESSSPKSGAHLSQLPKEVTLTFSEPVDLADLHVTLGGDELALTQDKGRDTVAVTVPQRKAKKAGGRLALDWHVRSKEDGHPSSGAISFALPAHTGSSGAPAANDDAAPAAAPSGTVRTAWAVARWVGYLALALYVGGLAFLAMLWPEGTRERRTRRILASSWAAGLAATVAAAGLQGAYGAMGSIRDAFKASTYVDLLGSEVGVALACRALMWVLAAVVLAALLQNGERAARSPGWRVGAAVVCLGLLRTTGMAGHNSEGGHPGWGAVADLVHLLGISLWLGGLTLLLAGVLPRRRPHELSATVSGYSTLAGVSVAAIAAAGAVLTWQVVGSFDALFSTGYGQLLLVKLALLAGVLLIAQRSRGWVRTRLDIAVLLRGDRATVRPFVYSVAAETGLVLVVLAATSLLVTAAPGR